MEQAVELAVSVSTVDETSDMLKTADVVVAGLDDLGHMIISY